MSSTFKSPAPPPSEEWHKYARSYDPIRIGSIDGTDTEAHDHAIVRALQSTYRPPEPVGKPRHTVFVARLHPRTDEHELRHRFRHCGGRIRSCDLVCDIVTGTPRGYAFLVFDGSSAAREAVRSMNGSEIHGQRIVVEHECERTLKGWRPRRLGGGFGGRKESGQLRFGCVDRPFQRPIASGSVVDRRPERSSRR